MTDELGGGAGLAGVRRHALAESFARRAFDRLARLAAGALGAPAAVVALLDEGGLVVRGETGLDEPWATAAPWRSACERAMRAPGPVLVADARRLPAGGAYAGVAVRDPAGEVVGALCALEPAPRVWGPEHRALLEDLAATATAELRLEAATEAALTAHQRAIAEEAERQQAEHRWRDLVEHARFVTYIGDGAPLGALLYVSPQIEGLTGYSRAELYDDRVLWHSLVHPEDRTPYVTAREDALGRGAPYDIEYRITRKDGRVAHVLDRLTVMYDEYGRPAFVQGSLADITARREAEAALRATEHRLRAVVASAPIILFAFDMQARLTMCEGRALDELGLRSEDVVGRSLLEQGAGEPAFLAALERALAGEAFRAEVHIAGRVWDTDYAPLRALGGEQIGVTGVALDVTERHRSAEEVARLAFHDQLTGLPNRRTLEEHLTPAVARAGRTGNPGALCFVDLDDFKAVNDSLGHAAGDDVLRQVAERLRAVIRAGDLLARQGGDEFLLLLEDLGEDARAAASAAAKLLAALEPPFVCEGAEFHVGASIGIAIFPEHGEEADVLMRHADQAMYAAKRGRRGSSAIYEATPQALADRLTLSARLRRALAADELELHYQPVYDVRAAEIVAVEALVRWQDPERGLLPPGAFIPLAEESGLIEELGARVLDHATAQLADWDERGIHVSIGVNASPREFAGRGFAGHVEDALARHGADPERLVVEVTESTTLRDHRRADVVLHELAEAGVRIAIDDFGVQYSSLARLAQLPVHILKIDRGFLRDVPRDARASALFAAVVRVGRALGVDTVSEGIERDDQLAFVDEVGCPYGQGFHLGRPLPVAEIEPLLPRGA